MTDDNIKEVINPRIIVVPILKKVEETIAGIINKMENGLNQLMKLKKAIQNQIWNLHLYLHK